MYAFVIPFVQRNCGQYNDAFLAKESTFIKLSSCREDRICFRGAMFVDMSNTQNLGPKVAFKFKKTTQYGPIVVLGIPLSEPKNNLQNARYFTSLSLVSLRL